MFVLDFADDRLKQILDGDETVGAAVLVDDDGHVDALLLHLLQQIAHRHQRRHEEHGADDFELVDGLLQRRRDEADRHFLFGIEHRRGDAAQRILDVDEADDVVDRVLVDRDARVIDLAEMRNERAETRFGIDGLDIGRAAP